MPGLVPQNIGGGLRIRSNSWIFSAYLKKMWAISTMNPLSVKRLCMTASAANRGCSRQPASTFEALIFHETASLSEFIESPNYKSINDKNEDEPMVIFSLGRWRRYVIFLNQGTLAYASPNYKQAPTDMASPKYYRPVRTGLTCPTLAVRSKPNQGTPP